MLTGSKFVALRTPKLQLGDLRRNFSRERSDQSVSLLNHLKQGLLPWNS